MKTKLKVLVLLFAVIFVITFIGEMTTSFSLGMLKASYNHGYNAAATGQNIELTDLEMAAQPMDSTTAFVAVNKVTGKKVRIWPSRAYIEYEDPQKVEDESYASIIIYLILSLVIIAVSLMAIDYMVRFLYSLYKGNIFDEHNFRRLNKYGICTIVVGLLTCVIILMDTHSDLSSLQMVGYTLSHNTDIWMMLAASLPEGILCMLLSQAFFLGKKQKDELDYTI